MKIEFIKHRYLNSLSRTIAPGETLESSATVPEALLMAYVSNGIAKTLLPPTPPKTGGESVGVINNTKLPSGGE